MKIIRSQRLSDQKSSEDEDNVIANLISVNEPHAAESNINASNRDITRRTTCRGLENNFNKI